MREVEDPTIKITELEGAIRNSGINMVPRFQYEEIKRLYQKERENILFRLSHDSKKRSADRAS